MKKNEHSVVSGGSKGGARDAPVQIPSISCSFWENLAKSYVGAPPGSWRPLLGEILDPPLVVVKIEHFISMLSLLIIEQLLFSVKFIISVGLVVI